MNHSNNQTDALVVTCAPKASFYLPSVSPPTGTALPKADWPQNECLPLLFTPIKVGPLEMHSRIVLAPMCQYSADPSEGKTGLITPWHHLHLGAIAARGVGMVIIEATSVLPNGRISPQDLGLWSEAHRDELKKLVDFIHTLGTKIGVQLSHAGRKASTLAPWIDISTIAPHTHTHVAKPGAEQGWEDVWGPSAITHGEGYPDVIEMTDENIQQLKQAWEKAVRWADEAGVDMIEIHAAHGYMLHNFLSPLSNKRSDAYGGSLDKRLKLTLDIIDITKAALPSHKAVFLRISATDWHPQGEKDGNGQFISWGLEQSKVLVREAIKHGVDLVDVSSGGNDPDQQIRVHPGYQTGFAADIRAELKGQAKTVPISTVGLVTSGSQAEKYLQTGKADLVTVGREAMRDPSFVLRWATEMHTVVNVPPQYQRAWTRMMKRGCA